MLTRIFWIAAAAPWRLAIAARPRGGDWLAEEIAGWKSAGIDQVVSLLEFEEAELLDLDAEPDTCRRLGIGFTAYPIADADVPPSFEEVRSLASRIADGCAAGEAIAIHCRAGIGRSSVIAATALIIGGFETQAALDAIGTARGVQVPDTREQRDWLFGFERRIRG
ncbi:protein-tyrosine phosphatase family protein [Flavisphingomonas formosensis]|uniref:protein-tyrosine phosphatase family protein n=1 Tax=Flavisphingomonas formosensis TaxID=861534 RepID=UPI0012FC28E1|nr:protein-tyrosine phosphatase family protein [Sphingomonas formosensis]